MEKEEEEKYNNAFNFGSVFSFLFSLFSAFMKICVCVAFSIFIFSAYVLIVVFAINQHE
jgi:hypothetical protein